MKRSRRKIDLEKDEWIDFIDGKFVDISGVNPCFTEQDIKLDWNISKDKYVNDGYSSYGPKKALCNWTDRAIMAARMLWE